MLQNKVAPFYGPIVLVFSTLCLE